MYNIFRPFEIEVPSQRAVNTAVRERRL